MLRRQEGRLHDARCIRLCPVDCRNCASDSCTISVASLACRARMLLWQKRGAISVQASPEDCRFRHGDLLTLQEVTLEYMEANGLLDLTLEVRYTRLK